MENRQDFEDMIDYQAFAGIFRILSNPVRLEILTRLAQGPVCVGDLVRCTCRRQAYVSQQLMLLRTEGWVVAEKEGWSVCYKLADTTETQWLNNMIRNTLSNFETRKKESK